MSLYKFARKMAFAFSLGGAIKLPKTICRRMFAHAKAVEEVRDFDGDLFMRLDLSEHMQRRIFWMGYYNNDVVPLLKKLLRPGMTFIDIGANVGEISLITGKLVGSGGKVISFEPVHAMAEKLHEHVKKNAMDWVVIVESGLSDHEGEAPIYSTTGNNGTKDKHLGLSSLHYVGQDLVPMQYVHLTTLDVFIEKHPVSRIDGIKIDIEGAELECLRGALDTLKVHTSWLIVEVQQETSSAAGYGQEEILDLLASLGYKFYEIEVNKSLKHVTAGNLQPIQNVFCVPKNFTLPA